MEMEIVRGYIIPYIKDDRIVYTDIINQKMREDILNYFLKDIINKVKEDYVKRVKHKISTANDLNYFLNLLTIFIKSSLYIDQIRGIVIAPISGLYEHYILEHKKDLKCTKSLYTEKGLREYVYMLVEKKEKLIKKPEIEIMDTIIKMPADTRIGLNTSSLIIHLLTTSGISSAIYISKRKKDISIKELTILRLLSMFHDIGKIVEWKAHEKRSALILREIFDSKIIEERSEAWEIIENVANILEGKVKENIYYEIFKEADKIASGVDRVKELVPIVLSKDKKDMLEKKIIAYLSRLGISTKGNLEDDYKQVFDDWNFWNEFLTIEERIELTKDFCKNVSRISSNGEIYETMISKREKLEEVFVVKFDFASIQHYIKSNDLRSLMGGSRIVDIIIYASIPDLLINLGIPYECVLIFGGGNLIALIPSNKINEIREELSKLDIPGVKINIGISPLYDSYIAINREIEKDIFNTKILSNIKPKHNITLDIYKKCEFCGKENAEESKYKESLCKKCQYKYEIGTNEYFKYRIISFFDWKIKNDYLPLMNEKTDILFFIAGHTIKEAAKILPIEEYKNLAIIRFDGNIIGQFMASAISITDIFERSIRIDKAVKDAINRFYNILREISEEDALRFVLGILYIGGDDGMLIVPSWLSIPLSLYLLNHYYYSLGGKSTLSLSIVGAKPKHPLIPLYDCAGHLLDRYAKDNGGRKLCYEICHSRSLDHIQNNFRGAIAFYNIDTGRLSPEYIDEILETLSKRDKVSMQYRHTYTLSDINEKHSIFRLLSLAFPRKLENIDLQEINLDKLNEDFIKKMIKLHKIESFIEAIKHRKNIINDIISINIEGESDFYLKVAYVTSKYSSELEAELGINAQTILKNLLEISESGFQSFNLADLLILIKILGGGESGI